MRNVVNRMPTPNRRLRLNVHTTESVGVGRFALRAKRRAVWISIVGDLDRACPPAADVVERVAQSSKDIVLLDLRAASKLDSFAIDWLEQVTAKLVAMGVSVRIVSQEGSKVSRILRVMKFDRFLGVFGSLAGALRFGRKARTLRLRRAPSPAGGN
ncbi:MAG: STAS domain-containing protein [Armatimonadetes bacterium]|nr:STAS domain-containing protein [Armatimonadota bacterium]